LEIRRDVLEKNK